MPKEFEITFYDLSKEAQERLLKSAGLKSPEEANWGRAIPIAFIVIGEEDN
jgi:hypothetical protein